MTQPDDSREVHYSEVEWFDVTNVSRVPLPASLFLLATRVLLLLRRHGKYGTR